MKKFITTLLAVLYICTSTGATLQMHYCMGQLADVELGHKKGETCGKCGMTKEMGKESDCCKDVHKFLKNDTDQKSAQAGLQLMQLLAAALPPYSLYFQDVFFPTLCIQNPVSHAPTIINTTAVYIRNCAFLI